MNQRTPVPVPTLEELQRMVRPSLGTQKPEEDVGMPTPRQTDAPNEKPRLSPDAEDFLRHAALARNRRKNLEARWKDLEVESGAVKKRVLSELKRGGFIRLDRKGREKVVHIYGTGWEYLDRNAPKGEGRGGEAHRHYVDEIKKMYLKQGFDVEVELEAGPNRKRVDLVVFGTERIGVEVGLSSVKQEVKNIREDLATGVLDRIIEVCADPEMLDRVRVMASADPAIAPHFDKITFLTVKEILSA